MTARKSCQSIIVATAVPAILLAACLAPAAAAPLSSAQRSEAEVRADIAFARGLASEWSFTDLAAGVLVQAERGGVSGRLREELGLARCEVFGAGASIEPDDARRNQLFEQALEEYQSFIRLNPNSDLRSSAEAALVATAAKFSISIDISLERAIGEEAATLKERKIEVLTEAVKLTQDLIDGILTVPVEERSAAQKKELEGLMLNRGTMLGQVGAASKDGVYFFEQAIVSLENMIFEFGEGTPQALRAYKAMGDVYVSMGDNEQAFWMYEGVLNQAWPDNEKLMEDLVDANDGPFAPDEVAYRYLFLEIAMPGLLETCVSQGEMGRACEIALHYYNTRQTEGLNWSDAGYQGLLACARTLLEAGGYVGGNQSAGETRWFATEEEMKAEVRTRRHHSEAVSFALQLANIVNEDNKESILQVHAQKVISEIANRPGIEVSLDVLLQAAEGEYNDQNLDVAIEAFKRVLSRLESRPQADQIEYGGRVMNFLANSHRRDDRWLEAAMAFREGIVNWKGDDEINRLNSQGYRFAMKRVTQASPGDPTLEGLMREANDLVIQYGAEASKDEISFNQGMEEYGNKNWTGAIREFERISEDANYYERALVQTAICKFRGGQSDEALAELEAYLDDYVTDPSNSHESPIRQAKRTEAMSAAEFFRGLILYGRAKKSGDEALWARVNELLTGYTERYPTQDVLGPWSVQMVMESRLALGLLDEARTAIEALIADHPDNKRTSLASIGFYKHLRALREESTDAAQKSDYLRQMAEFLKIANASDTSFISMRNESLHWMELEDYVEAERVLRDLVAAFQEEPEHASKFVSGILPNLGEALLANAKIQDAKDVLTPLVLEASTTPSKGTVLNWARSVSGWLTGGGPAGQVQEIAGAGGTPKEWQEVIDKLDLITRSEDKWVCAWYEHKLMLIYAYYAWSAQDDRKRESAKGQLGQLDDFFTQPGYAEIEASCSGEENQALASRLGTGVLQARFQYVARLLR